MFNRLLLFQVIVSILFFSGCNITGRVVDENGAGVAGVTVTLSGTASLTTITASDGTYQFGSSDDMLSAGSYTVTPSKSGRIFEPGSKIVTITMQGNFTRSVNEVNFIGTHSSGSLSDGLVAHYPFNGDATDASGNGNDGMVYGAKRSTDRFGNKKSAYRFDGIDDYIDIADSDELNFGEDDFTISLWLKYPSQEGGSHDYSAVINKAENPNNPYEGFTLFVDNPTSGQACFRTQYEYELHSNSNTLNDNTWRHFVLIRKNGGLNIYLDSVLDSSGEPPITTDVSNNANIRLGANHIVPTSQNFTGDMDDIRLYNRALSEAEIQAFYNEESPIDSDDGKYDDNYDDDGDDDGDGDDYDDDGVPDTEDNCHESDMSLMVVIDGCDTGVENHLLDDGCTISDSIAECEEEAENNGKFVSCVTKLTKKLKKAKIISKREEQAIKSCAARADIP